MGATVTQSDRIKIWIAIIGAAGGIIAAFVGADWYRNRDDEKPATPAQVATTPTPQSPSPVKPDPRRCRYPLELKAHVALAAEVDNSRVMVGTVCMNRDLEAKGWRFVPLSEKRTTVDPRIAENRLYGTCGEGKVEDVVDDAIIVSARINNNAGRTSNMSVGCNIHVLAVITHPTATECPKSLIADPPDAVCEERPLPGAK